MKKVLYNDDKFKYPVHLKIGIAISLSICILFFLFCPSLKQGKKEVPCFPEPIITLVDIPNTNKLSNTAPPMPAVPAISALLKPINEPEPLQDIEIKVSSKSETVSDVVGKSKQGNGIDIYEASSFQFIPRQILEVVPQKVDGVKGFIKIRVLVGIDGYVKQHKILNNTTNSQKCLDSVLEAAYKSRWQPISIEGEKVEYWIEKIYTFD